MRKKIIALRKRGYSYDKIVKTLGCAKSTVAYHLGLGQKEKSSLRSLKRRDKKNKTDSMQRAFIREFIFRYKKIKGCSDCGIKNPIVLDFDHRDRSIKIIRVSQMIKGSVSIVAIKEEIRKCDIRCANCHRIKTAKELNWYKDLIPL